MSTLARLVLIEWEDSRHPVASWQRLNEFTKLDVCKCVSVGFLISDDDEQKVLASNMADIENKDNIQASGVIHIPSKCVLRITPIAETI